VRNRSKRGKSDEKTAVEFKREWIENESFQCSKLSIYERQGKCGSLQIRACICAKLATEAAIRSKCIDISLNISNLYRPKSISIV
jgi:hypothetical protein